VATTATGAGAATSSASASGGAAGSGGFGDGGSASAGSTATSSGGGNAWSSATATGGSAFFGGEGGSTTAMANATAAGGGTATAEAVAPGGAANATSTDKTAKGALAQAQSTAVGSSGQAQSAALTSYSFVKVQSAAVAQVGSTATTNAIAQGGGAGQAFANPGQTAYAFSTALPDKAYSATLIDGAHDVAGALLGPRDMVFGAAIVGANYATDGGGASHTYSATSTFDFGYGGDLMLGLIDDQVTGFAGGLGFQSMEFTVTANGVELFESMFNSLAVAESFFRDRVIDLGSDFGGPGIDLTIAYNLVADGSGGFGFDFALGGAVPEPSTWAMMLIGFAGLGYAGYRRSSERAARRIKDGAAGRRRAPCERPRPQDFSTIPC
jgi:PEP-CTERM motif